MRHASYVRNYYIICMQHYYPSYPSYPSIHLSTTHPHRRPYRVGVSFRDNLPVASNTIKWLSGKWQAAEEARTAWLQTRKREGKNKEERQNVFTSARRSVDLPLWRLGPYGTWFVGGRADNMCRDTSCFLSLHILIIKVK